ncbi:MAG: endonuclease III [Gammaproteobacteria bacterium RIFOXYB2_FULL_38_6]|nr:MAG: endonuclease III [Gammaproteobacteria bacterium RIFOXYB2_FULL_38_6]
MLQKTVQAIFERLQKERPHPKSELNYCSPFELLIAVILSAQATDKSVNLATPKLFKIANTPEKMAALGEENLKKYIKTIGLYHTKAKNIISTSKFLMEKFNSQIPNNRKDLESLPGVGRKTANIILNVLFNEKTLAVDTHIFRIANRTGLAKGKTPLAVEKKLMGIVPERYLKDAHHWLILHGRYTCTARKPKCSECCIQKFCGYKDKNG